MNRKQRVLVGATDVGPIEYLKLIADSNSSLVFDWFERSLITIDSSQNTSLISKRLACLKVNYRLVVTGTQLGCGFDKALVNYASKRQIPSVSVIEHWSWYKKRFECGNELILPDFIIVNDEIAYKDAVDDGLPADRIRVLGNPVLEDAYITAKDWKTSSPTLKKKFGIRLGQRVIVFVSEQLRADFRSGNSDDLGYDEYEVLEMIISTLASNDILLIKLHPAEAAEKYSHLEGEQIKLIRNACPKNLAYIGDVIIGMGSILLLEIAMIRGDVISFRPSAKIPFIGDKLGATVTVTTEEELRLVMTRRNRAPSNFGRKFLGSRARIISFLERTIT